MVTELFEGRDLGADGNVISENLHFIGFVLDRESAGAGRLESDEEHEIARIGKALGEVVQDAATRDHAAGRNDDCRHPRFVDLF